MASLWMLFASFAFSAMGACVKLASQYYTTSEIVLYRGLTGVLVLGFLVRHQGGTLRTALAGAHLWRGTVGVISLWLWFFCIARLPLATAMTLNYMAPIWVAVLLFLGSWWHAKNKVEWPLVAAILMSFLGVTLVLRPAFAADQWMAGLTGLSSGVLSGFAYLQVRRLGQQGEPEYRVVFYFSLITVVAGLIGIGATPAYAVAVHSHAWPGAGLLLAIGLCATAAQMAMTRAYRVGKTLVVANLQYSGIIFSSAWAVLLWGDQPDWHTWLGMAIILCSGIAATFYNTRQSASRATTDPIAAEL